MDTTKIERNEIAERNQKQSPLLRLPPEVRLHIFELALDTAFLCAYPLSTSGDWSDFQRILPGFITACRQIHHESKPLLSKHSILEVGFSRYFIGINKFRNHNIRKIKIYDIAAREIMWMWHTVNLGSHYGFLNPCHDRDLLCDSFPAIEIIDFPSYWKGGSGEKSCEDAVQYWFKRKDLQVTYHWDLEPKIDLED
ncbi:hypothetical protein G6514_000985 [Epicoccum nigrum]|nr:hypothetical protein G6514_000985 [Epicoccum nigrum]